MVQARQPLWLMSVALEAVDGCSGGAIQIDSGVDTNGDGVLDAAEIVNTELICEPNTSGDACTLEDVDGVKVLTCGDTSAVVLEEPNRIVASIACIGMLEGQSFSFDYSVAQMAYGDVFASASIRDVWSNRCVGILLAPAAWFCDGSCHLYV